MCSAAWQRPENNTRYDAVYCRVTAVARGDGGRQITVCAVADQISKVVKPMISIHPCSALTIEIKLEYVVKDTVADIDDVAAGGDTGVEYPSDAVCDDKTCA